MRENTWWGSAADPPPSWSWSHWLWGDTVNRLNPDPGRGVSPGSHRWKSNSEVWDFKYSWTISNVYIPFISNPETSKGQKHNFSSKASLKWNIKKGIQHINILACNVIFVFQQAAQYSVFTVTLTETALFSQPTSACYLLDKHYPEYRISYNFNVSLIHVIYI